MRYRTRSRSASTPRSLTPTSTVRQSLRWRASRNAHVESGTRPRRIRAAGEDHIWASHEPRRSSSLAWDTHHDQRCVRDPFGHRSVGRSTTSRAPQGTSAAGGSTAMLKGIFFPRLCLVGLLFVRHRWTVRTAEERYARRSFDRATRNRLRIWAFCLSVTLLASIWIRIREASEALN